MDKRYADFIDRITADTKAGVYKWEYLDSRQDIIDKCDLSYDDFQKTYYRFDADRSFILPREENNTYLLLVEQYDDDIGGRNIFLEIIPNTFKTPLFLNAQEYGEQITRLHNAVKRQFPSPEDFIDLVLGS